MTTHPSMLFQGVPSPGGGHVTWGLSDLTIYATAYVDGSTLDFCRQRRRGCEHLLIAAHPLLLCSVGYTLPTRHITRTLHCSWSRSIHSYCRLVIILQDARTQLSAFALANKHVRHTQVELILLPLQGGSHSPLLRWQTNTAHHRYYRNFIVDGPTSCNNKSPPWGCTAHSDGFVMRRVRIRANAYFASVWGPFSTHERPRPNVNFNFSQDDIQEVVLLSGRSWAVTECDVLGTGTIFGSGGSGGGYGGTSWGHLHGNTVRNGGNTLAMDQWKQVIVENNVISGASLASAGNNIASYNGG